LDRTTVIESGKDLAAPLFEKYDNRKVTQYIEDMLEDMADNLRIFAPQAPPQKPGAGPQPMMPDIDLFRPYKVNLLVDNRQIKSPPVITEEYPTHSNIFGSIERVVDRSGLWRTDFSKINAGSLLKANGGFLVINLKDAIIEPGVWQSLKRALKSKKLEIHSFDPIYAVATGGLKPEPIALDVKVVLIADAYLYSSLLSADEDLKKVFKVRADFDTVMEKNEQNIVQFARFIKMATDEEGLRPLDRTAVAAVVEQAVRMAGRQEKISTSFPAVTDLIREADFWAAQADESIIRESHIDKAIESKIFRSNLMEKRLQEMIHRGTVMIDTEGAVVGQVNGLAVYMMGDYAFGKPSRITASTSMGRVGLINIEREAKMSGKTHDKGVLILSGYLRKKFAQDKPLTISASIAFEQSYSGVDGDSASSTEIYAILSSLSKVPIRQDIAVTGSVNQKGEVQAIGGVNQKIEGFFDCCQHKGLTGSQGVMIPASNVNDLMLRKDVVAAVQAGQFKLYAVEHIDQGIEVLTGERAGELAPDGTYPEGSLFFMVDQALRELAEGLKNFGNNDEDKKKDAGPSGCRC
jgi:lon-related putative ATP-dependent protease